MKLSLSAALLTGIVVSLSPSVARAQAEEETRPDRPQTKAPEKSDDDTDAFRIGALGGLGFPRPLAIEALVKIEGVLALGVEYSLFPKTNLGGVETTFWALAADARLFPFRNGFFIGMRAGHQRMAATATADLGAFGSFSESALAETWFVNPRIGFLWTWNSGFTVGIDAGVQIPISPSLSTTLPAGLPANVDGTIASIANTFGNEVTPTVDLLRIGFLF